MIELSHLEIIAALNAQGTLTAAAQSLNLTQSALSHQIRYLEKKLEVRLWKKEGRRLYLTQEGQLLLQAAHQLLPVMQQLNATIKAHSLGMQGILRIGVECYPCQEWLSSVMGHFMRTAPKVDVDIVNQFQFTGLEALLNHHIDIWITPDKIDHAELEYAEFFDYESVLLVANEHPLAKRSYVEESDLSEQLLLTFPVNKERLDIYTQWLLPWGGALPQVRQIASLEVMLQMVSLQRGVCVLPDWLAESYKTSHAISPLKLGVNGIAKILYGAIRQHDNDVAYIQSFLSLGKEQNVADNSQFDISY